MSFLSSITGAPPGPALQLLARATDNELLSANPPQGLTLHSLFYALSLNALLLAAACAVFSLARRSGSPWSLRLLFPRLLAAELADADARAAASSHASGKGGGAPGAAAPPPGLGASACARLAARQAPPPLPSPGAARALLRLPDEALARCCGLDGLALVALSDAMAKLFGAAALVLPPLLCPLYSAASPPRGDDRYGVAGLADGSGAFWAAALAGYGLAGAALWLASAAEARLLAVRLALPPPGPPAGPEEFCVLVTDVPPGQRSADKVAAFFARLYAQPHGLWPPPPAAAAEAPAAGGAQPRAPAAAASSAASSAAGGCYPYAVMCPDVRGAARAWAALKAAAARHAAARHALAAATVRGGGGGLGGGAAAAGAAAAAAAAAAAEPAPPERLAALRSAAAAASAALAARRAELAAARAAALAAPSTAAVVLFPSRAAAAWASCALLASPSPADAAVAPHPHHPHQPQHSAAAASSGCGSEFGGVPPSPSAAAAAAALAAGLMSPAPPQQPHEPPSSPSAAAQAQAQLQQLQQQQQQACAAAAPWPPAGWLAACGGGCAWRVRPCPPLGSVDWAALQRGPLSRRARRAAAAAASSLVVLSFLFVVAAVARLAVAAPGRLLRPGSATAAFAAPLLQGYGAVAALLACLVAAPALLGWLASACGGHVTAGGAVGAATRAFLWLCLVDVFLGSAAIQEALRTLGDALARPGDAVLSLSSLDAAFGGSVPQAAPFFMLIALARAGTSAALALLRLTDAPLVAAAAIAARGGPPAARRAAWAPGPPPLAAMGTTALFTAFLGLVYGPLAPLVLVAVAAFFCGSSLLLRYQLAYVYAHPSAGDGRLWLHLRAGLFDCGTLAAAVLTAVLALHRCPGPAAAAAALALAAFCGGRAAGGDGAAALARAPADAAAAADAHAGTLPWPPPFPLPAALLPECVAGDDGGGGGGCGGGDDDGGDAACWADACAADAAEAAALRAVGRDALAAGAAQEADLRAGRGGILPL